MSNELLKNGDKVRIITRDEYDNSPSWFRSIMVEYSPTIWSHDQNVLVIKDIKDCLFSCQLCDFRKRVTFRYRGMDSMCGMLYRKDYAWKKL